MSTWPSPGCESWPRTSGTSRRGCWPAQHDDENAELRALAQGTGDHLPYELRVAELRTRRERPWSPEAA